MTVLEELLTWSPDRPARRVTEVFQRLSTLKPTAFGAEELTPEDLAFLRFEVGAQEVFDTWRAGLEQTLRGEAEHPVWRSHVAKYRSLMPSLAVIGHLIYGVAGGPTGLVSQAAAARAVAWCTYLQGHARRLYASVTDRTQVAAALLAAKLTHGRLPSPFTARDVYRNEWTGLTEPRVVQGALEGLAELGWVRAEQVRGRDGGRPTVRFRINPQLRPSSSWSSTSRPRRPSASRFPRRCWRGRIRSSSSWRDPVASTDPSRSLREDTHETGLGFRFSVVLGMGPREPHRDGASTTPSPLKLIDARTSPPLACSYPRRLPIDSNFPACRAAVVRRGHACPSLD